MDKKYYIAYGSNLNMEQMSYRCPTARVVGTGMLRDFRLMFSVFATIIPEPGSCVPVAIWEIDECCEERLDLYEGFPNFYRKEYCDIELNGRTVNAMVYIKNSSRAEMPGIEYLYCVRQGYLDMKLDKEYLDSALIYTKSCMKK